MDGAVRLTFKKGLIDGPDPQDTPNDGAYVLSGFHCRDGYPKYEYGTLNLTSASIATTSTIYRLFAWSRSATPTTELYYAVCGTHLYAADSNYDYTTLGRLNKLGVTATTATRASNTVTIAGGTCLRSVAAGDKFFYDADGFAKAGNIASVDSNTQLTLTSYPGSGTSGNFTILRPLGSTVDVAFTKDDRVVLTDGTKMYWYGEDGTSTSTTVFRPAGVEKPTTRPSVTLAAGGSLTAGNYRWYVALKDKWGNVGPAVDTIQATATSTQKCTLASLPSYPSWVSELMVYRTFVNGDRAYSIGQGLDAQLKSVGAFGGGQTVLTLNDTVPNMTADIYIGRRVTTNVGTYTVADNDTRTLTVTGDASTTAATSWVTIPLGGGYDITTVTSVVDLVADTALDYTNECPGTLTNVSRSFNEPPPASPKYVYAFRGGGRMVCVTGSNRCWFSGRPALAPLTGQQDRGGLGEYDYWPHYHDCGDSADPAMGFVELGGELYAIKRQSVWVLDRGGSDDVSLWQWARVPGSNSFECTSHGSICRDGGVAYWQGRHAGQNEIVAFDGSYCRGIGRPRLKACLDGIVSGRESQTEGAAFGGRIYFSYTATGTTNNRTLRYDTLTDSWDLQLWGCGTFSNTQSSNLLLCGAVPTNESHVFSVRGSATTGGGSNLTRTLTTGDVLPGAPEDEATFSDVVLEVYKEA